MKILYQSTSFIPSYSANSIHVMSMVDEFASMGNEVFLLGLEGNIDAPDSDYEYYGVKNKFKIYKFNYDSFFSKIKYFIGSVQIAREIGPDFIVSRSHVGAFLLLFFGFKVILDAHRPVWEGSFIKKYLWNYFRKFENLRVTTNSQGLKDMFKDSDCLPKYDITVAFNGSKKYPLDSFYFEDREQLNIGYIGGLYPGRGIDIIIKIAEMISNVKFHIAGGSEKDILELKNSYSIPNNIVFYGHIAPSDVFKFRNSCDVLLAPYHKKGIAGFGKHFTDQSQYQNPIKVIEYLSAKKPIIASSTKSIKEILNADIAFLVDPESISDWVETITYLMKNRSECKDIAARGYEFFDNNLTWNARAKKMLEIAQANFIER